ncbi:MAG: hypothetical protein IAI50_15170, partial [Candidatus Eremiobacteraeota bacterium]|nr:hypothetical protein [Candidatus Eremiobacteraeota bacterium]
AAASGSFTATKITVTVPSGALTGPITVTTANGSAQSSTFTVDGSTPTPTPSCTPAAGQLPTICSIAPKSGKVGSTVTIDGYHLAPLKSVIFNKGMKATASATVRKVTAEVPAGAISGPIKVTTGYGSVESGRFLVETSAPAMENVPVKQ